MDIHNLENVTGTIFNIQKFCTDDGPGIRTTVFLKGCHLNCQWCHNPEGLDSAPILDYADNLCKYCRRCEAVCKNGCHSFANNEHSIDRSGCNNCGQCQQACIYGALKSCGQIMTASEVIKTALADKAFYEKSGGGITISGGEPLLQPDFVLAICALAKENGIHTCIETSGAVDFEVIRQIKPYVDLFLYDIKETDNENHKRYVGISNLLPLENIQKLNELGADILIRCPIIPGVNDRNDHFSNLKKLYDSLNNAIGIQLMPYHALGQGKTDRFGIKNINIFTAPSDEDIAKWYNQLQIKDINKI